MSTFFLILVGWSILEVLTRRPLGIELFGLLLIFLNKAKFVRSIGNVRFYGVRDFNDIFNKIFPRIAIACGGIVLVKTDTATDGIIAHEVEHVRQQVKYGTLGFAVIYFGSWLYLWLRYKNNLKAYYHVPFEILAFRAQHGLEWVPPK